MPEPVEVPDVQPPKEPRTSLDDLGDYIGGRYLERKEEIVALLSAARELSYKGTLVELVYEVLLFKAELEEWLAFAQEVLDEVHGDQLGIAHTEGASEAKERGSSRPLTKVVEARAAQFTAPLRRTVAELKGTRDWLDKIMFWCQAQPKLIRDEEYGASLEAQNLGGASESKDRPLIVHPPSPTLGRR